MPHWIVNNIGEITFCHDPDLGWFHLFYHKTQQCCCRSIMLFCMLFSRCTVYIRLKQTSQMQSCNILLWLFLLITLHLLIKTLHLSVESSHFFTFLEHNVPNEQVSLSSNELFWSYILRPSESDIVFEFMLMIYLNQMKRNTFSIDTHTLVVGLMNMRRFAIAIQATFATNQLANP